MAHEVKKETDSGINISLQIPAQDPELYKNKATDDVLLFLSRHSFEDFSLAEIATQTDNTEPTVGRAVDVLEANGLVIERTRGTQRLISINRDRLSVPDDPFLRIPQPEFQRPVKVAVEALEERIGNLLGVLLYGSVARGEADRRSDIDLWVLVSEDRPPAQRTANEIARDLEEREFETGRYAYDIDVEAVASIPTYTEAVREIVLSGIPVYTTAEFETVERLLMDEVDDGGADE